MGTSASICLNMIVRDEEHVILEALGCVLPHIDTWVIVDTGSKDRTMDVIRDFFRDAGLEGELHQRPWRDFGTNRTEALRLCEGKADYAWVMDADDLVVGDLELPRLTLDAYALRFGTSFTYWRTQIFRTTRPFCYRGVVHEYAACEDGAYTSGRIQGDYHVESRRLGARNRAEDKYERDCALLHAALEKDPDDSRSVFYLAQSYLDAGKPEQALKWYRKRASMGGWAEEVYYSLFKAAECMQRLGHPWEKVQDAYLRAHEARPVRAEPLHAIARQYRLQDRFALAHVFARRAAELAFPHEEKLFVHRDVYSYKALDELSIASYYTGRHRDSFEQATRALRSRLLPDDARTRIEENRDFSVPHIKDDYIAYPAHRIREITRRIRRRKKTPHLTLTVTTCKRLALFEKTMNSFIHCCTDIHLVDRFVCVDDNSTEQDRQRMKELYPFFEFVFKTPDQKGHSRSMNIILDQVQSPWWLHMEDDWHFFCPLDYITVATKILQHDRSLGQVLFNRNYAQTLAHRKLVGGKPAWTESGHRYRVHEYIPHGSPRWPAFWAAHPPGSRTNAWWPHFSLQPSLIRREAIAPLGPFDEMADHFEMEMARRYTRAGLRTAFLDTITCLHTGALTWERDPDRNPNAYDLNDVPQFRKSGWQESARD